MTASTLVAQAEQEFPWDADLMQVKEKVTDALKLRTKAQKGLADAQKLLANQQWEEGASAIVRACRSAAQDQLIQERGASELLQACKSASERNWRAGEILLKQLSELQPGMAVPAELQTRIGELKKEESLQAAIREAKRLQAAGDLQAAARELARVASAYPQESRLLMMQRAVDDQIRQAEEKERQERARQERETYVKDVLERAQQEKMLESRIGILEEGSQRAPGEARLQQQLSQVRNLAEDVATLAADARMLQQSGKYDQALAKWDVLRAKYPQFPDIDKQIDGTRVRQRLAQLEAKQKVVAEIQAALNATDYEHATHLLARAKAELGDDRDLASLENRVREKVAQRAEAQKLLVTAMKAVGKSQWQKAAESFREACQGADADPVIREQALRGLLQASEAALKSDVDVADMLFGEAARAQPNSSLLAPMRAKIQDHKRERLLEQCLAGAASARASEDLPKALREVDRGLSMYPDEPGLLREREEIQNLVRRKEENQRRAKEQVQHRRAPTAPVRAVPRTWSEEEAPKPGAPTQMPASAAAPTDQMATQLFDPQSSIMPAPEFEKPATPKRIEAIPVEVQKIEAPLPAIPSPTGTDTALDPSKASGATMPPAYTQTLTSVIAGASPEWTAELRAIERDLAVYLGPLARIMVKRAAAKTTNLDELCKQVAQSLERDEDRDAFLQQQSKRSRSRAKAQIIHEIPAVPPVTTALNPLSPLGITPDAIDHAAKMLAAHVGPISMVLAKKAARRADSVQSFYRLLSEHVQNSAERRRFLRDAGFPDA